VQKALLWLNQNEQITPTAAAGFAVGVTDGEEATVTNCTDKTKIMNAVSKTEDFLLSPAPSTARLARRHYFPPASHPPVPTVAGESRPPVPQRESLSCNALHATSWPSSRFGPVVLAKRSAFRSLILALTPGSHKLLKLKEKSAVVDRKSVEMEHLSVANLTAGDERQIIDPEEDRTVFPVQGAGSFVGFPSFYMHPTKLPHFQPSLTTALGAPTRNENGDFRAASSP
jgi:hypothetical protein